MYACPDAKEQRRGLYNCSNAPASLIRPLLLSNQAATYGASVNFNKDVLPQELGYGAELGLSGILQILPVNYERSEEVSHGGEKSQPTPTLSQMARTGRPGWVAMMDVQYLQYYCICCTMYVR
jgi:hypothetical protein